MADSLYIITSRDFNRHKKIFEISPKRGILHPVKSQFPEETYALNFTDILPIPPAMLQVRAEIIDLLIMSYLRSCNFELALRLISIDPSTIRRFYKKIFGNFNPQLLQTPSVIIIHYRIARTLKFAMNIYDSIGFMGNQAGDLYFALQTTISSPYYPHYQINPWNFTGPIDILQTQKPNIPNHETFQALMIGPYLTDVCWISGSGRNGIIRSSFLHVPIIHLIFQDKYDNLIPDISYVRNNSNFRSFALLLKHCFGPRTGVFITVHDASLIKSLPLL